MNLVTTSAAEVVAGAEYNEGRYRYRCEAVRQMTTGHEMKSFSKYLNEKKHNETDQLSAL